MLHTAYTSIYFIINGDPRQRKKYFPFHLVASYLKIILFPPKQYLIWLENIIQYQIINATWTGSVTILFQHVRNLVQNLCVIRKLQKELLVN